MSAPDSFIPADVDAERALLGAALFDRGAATIAAGVQPEDWHLADHRHTADAIRSLLTDEQHLDQIIVADRVRLAGEHHPTTAELTVLVNLTPSVSSAQRYADIVARHARHRRLIHLADLLTAAAMAGDKDRIDRRSPPSHPSRSHGERVRRS
jgi:replicative DNA helicase